MRHYFESIEDQFLADYAVKSNSSIGRSFNEPESETRTCFQRDRDRIVHSKAFRRLKLKTQVFIAGQSDHYRSRLTHTIEVAQISRHIARMLRLNEDLAECIALAHDLGHTPFGHSGEYELDALMKDYGGFEHNAQSFRIVTEIEKKYPQFRGLNLSHEVKEGLIKHSTPWDNPKTESKQFVSLEAQVVNIADEIAYNNHDIDDGLTSNILDEDHLDEAVEIWIDTKNNIKKQYSDLKKHELKHLINSEIISTLVKDVVVQSKQNIELYNIKTLSDVQNQQQQIVSFSPDILEKNNQLRSYLYKNFYCHHEIYRMNKKGQMIIRDLFNELSKDIKLLPQDYQDRHSENESNQRLVADYIAGMTDNYAVKEYYSMFT